MVLGICSGRTTRRQQLHRLEPVNDFYRDVGGEEFGQVSGKSHPCHLGTMTIRIAGTPTGFDGVEIVGIKGGSKQGVAAIYTRIEQTDIRPLSGSG